MSTEAVPHPAPEPVSPTAPALTGSVLMHQDWRDLTYVHWAVDPERLTHLMPPGVRPDVHDGASYVGLVPFRMVDAAPFRLPGVPWLGTFLETNVRLYSVDATGRRGVVFLSLDCDRLAVVLGARIGFGVPYRWARLRHGVTTDLATRRPVHTYDGVLRRTKAGNHGRNRVVVRVGDPRPATPLDEFLSARWGLHSAPLVAGRRTLYVPNQHPAWPLHDAELLDLDAEVLTTVGLRDLGPELARRAPDHVAFSPGVHTEFGWPGSAARPRP